MNETDPQPEIEGQTSLDDWLCTRDENCKADVTEHHPECPVEKQLLDLYGF